MENVFQQCVGEARDRGATVLLSSHILAETEALCDRVTIIRAGKTVESGTLDSMRHLSRTSIKAEHDRRSRRYRHDQGRRGRQHRRVTRCARRSTARASARSSRRLGDAGVRTLVSQPPTLEDLFLRHYDVGDESAEEVTA